jgi:hypothetical protein
MKLLLLISVTVILVLWLIIGVTGSILAGLAYGFLAPAMATFDAVGEGKEKPLVHCFVVQFTCNSFIVIQFCSYFTCLLIWLDKCRMEHGAFSQEAVQ